MKVCIYILGENIVEEIILIHIFDDGAFFFGIAYNYGTLGFIHVL